MDSSWGIVTDGGLKASKRRADAVRSVATAAVVDGDAAMNERDSSAVLVCERRGREGVTQQAERGSIVARG